MQKEIRMDWNKILSVIAIYIALTALGVSIYGMVGTPHPSGPQDAAAWLNDSTDHGLTINMDDGTTMRLGYEHTDGCSYKAIPDGLYVVKANGKPWIFVNWSNVDNVRFVNHG